MKLELRKSHELLQLEICDQRGIELDEVTASRLRQLRRGYEGENSVFGTIRSYGLRDVHMLGDYWFSHGKSLQVDMLVVYKNHWLVVEVKNYYGHFEYRNNECYLNGVLMDDNHIQQLTSRTQRLRHIARALDPAIVVDSVMVFVDEECQLDIQVPVEPTIIQMHQLKSYMKSFVKNYRAGVAKKTFNEVKEHLDKYRVPSPFRPMMIKGDLAKSRAKRGVHCKECGSYDTYTTSKQVRCRKCAFRESKHLVVKRLAQELRFIYYYNPEKITTHSIYELCGGVIGKSTIKYTLKSLFKRIEKGPKTYYDVQITE